MSSAAREPCSSPWTQGFLGRRKAAGILYRDPYGPARYRLRKGAQTFTLPAVIGPSGGLFNLNGRAF